MTGSAETRGLVGCATLGLVTHQVTAAELLRIGHGDGHVDMRGAQRIHDLAMRLCTPGAAVPDELDSQGGD